MNSIRDFLPLVYRQHVPGEQADEDLIRSYWRSAVGREIARRTRPARLKGGTLEVEVNDSAWVESLRSLRDRIIGRINAAIDRQAVQKIRFRAAGVIPRPLGHAETATGAPAAGERRRKRLG